LIILVFYMIVVCGNLYFDLSETIVTQISIN
jgi:hypothetical protein